MKLVHLVGFITMKFVTMHGHMNVKFINCGYLNSAGLSIEGRRSVRHKWE